MGQIFAKSKSDAIRKTKIFGRLVMGETIVTSRIKVTKPKRQVKEGKFRTFNVTVKKKHRR